MEGTSVQFIRCLFSGEQMAPFLEIQESRINICTYLGLGTRSSGTGVHVESGDFCSLNLPVKTMATSCMS